MVLLVLSVVLSVVSAAVEDSSNLQLNRYKTEIKYLSEVIAKECPGYIQQKRNATEIQKQNLELQASYVQILKERLLLCQQGKLAVTTKVPDPAPFCPSYDEDSVFNMKLISYGYWEQNATDSLCKLDKAPCVIAVKICVSSINSTECELYSHVTDVVGDKSKVNPFENLEALMDKVKINLGKRKWQGVNVCITVLQRNPFSSLKVYHELNEFSYNLTDAQGSAPRVTTLHGNDVTDHSGLTVKFAVPCPSFLTTLPTTTTSSPVPPECLMASNLTESWRLDHDGQAIKGGGPHSAGGYACDLRDIGWFRFTGAAGTHMLDTCPKYKSCGTALPYWTDGDLPHAVGITANIFAYEVYKDDCKSSTRTIQVMRCSLSTDHDLIYKYNGYYRTGTEICLQAFCGMN